MFFFFLNTTPRFKKMKSLVDHHKKTGHSEHTDSSDGVRNYCSNALTLCYLAKNFLDARKRGDGERVCRLYKHLLLYFKLDGRTKYSFQTLQLLSQLNFLLPPGLAHELKWNRFVNTKGHPDSNIELDRELEHRNKYVKEEIKSFRGKITDKAISRCSQSYTPMEELMRQFDKQSGHKKQSGKHTKSCWAKDVQDLCQQYVKEKIFVKENGRGFKNFPGISENYLNNLEMSKVFDWAGSRLKLFKNMNIYKHKGININNT